MMTVTIMKCRHRQEPGFRMPIHRMSFENGLFFAQHVGYLDHIDVSTWADALSCHAQNSEVPVMAVVDMLGVDRVCPTMPQVVTTLLQMSNVLGIALVTSDLMTSRNAPVFDELKALPGVRLFSTMDKALTYSKARLHPSIAPFSNQNLMRLQITAFR
jgi:hypothetical protein